MDEKTKTELPTEDPFANLPYPDPFDERNVATLHYNSPQQVEFRAEEASKAKEKHQQKARKIAGKLRRRHVLGLKSMVVNNATYGSPPHPEVYKHVDEQLAQHGLTTEVYRVHPWHMDYADQAHDIIRVRTKNGQEVSKSRYWNRKTTNGGFTGPGHSEKIHPPEEN